MQTDGDSMILARRLAFSIAWRGRTILSPTAIALC